MREGILPTKKDLKSHLSWPDGKYLGPGNMREPRIADLEEQKGNTAGWTLFVPGNEEEQVNLLPGLEWKVKVKEVGSDAWRRPHPIAVAVLEGEEEEGVKELKDDKVLKALDLVVSAFNEITSATIPIREMQLAKAKSVEYQKDLDGNSLKKGKICVSNAGMWGPAACTGGRRRRRKSRRKSRRRKKSTKKKRRRRKKRSRRRRK